MNVIVSYICILVLGLALALPATAAPAMSAENAVAQANRFGEHGDAAAAIALLRETLERYPMSEPVYLTLADWQEAQALDAMQASPADADDGRAILSKELAKYPDVTREIFDTYGKGLMYVPDSTAIRARVRALLAYHYPQVLGEYGVLALPGNPTTFAYQYTDPRLPSEKRGERHALMTMAAQPATRLYTCDPKYGYGFDQGKDSRYQHWAFDHMLVGYDFDEAQQRWRLRCRVMWQTVPDLEAERLGLAQHVTRTLLQLQDMARSYMGYAPRFTADGVVNVWLAEEGEAGGEAYNENIYLEQVGVARPAAEWLREVAHEFGHQVFPAVGGYADPEWGANGRMGERIFLRWLAANRGMDDEHPWLRQTDFVAVKRDRVDALIRRFAANGPQHPITNGVNAEGMDAFVGMALYLESVRGDQVLATILSTLGTPAFGGPKGFLQSVEDQETYLQSSERPSVLLRMRDLPDNLPLWVFLRDGKWRGTLTTFKEADMPMLNSLKVELDGTALKNDGRGGFTTPALAYGWHRITFSFTGDAPALSDVRLVRQ